MLQPLIYSYRPDSPKVWKSLIYSNVSAYVCGFVRDTHLGRSVAANNDGKQSQPVYLARWATTDPLSDVFLPIFLLLQMLAILIPFL